MDQVEINLDAIKLMNITMESSMFLFVDFVKNSEEFDEEFIEEWKEINRLTNG